MYSHFEVRPLLNLKTLDLNGELALFRNHLVLTLADEGCRDHGDLNLSQIKSTVNCRVQQGLHLLPLSLSHADSNKTLPGALRAEVGDHVDHLRLFRDWRHVALAAGAELLHLRRSGGLGGLFVTRLKIYAVGEENGAVSWKNDQNPDSPVEAREARR